MDWKHSIKRNRDALVVVVAGLIAMVGQWSVDPRVKPGDDGLRSDPISLSRIVRRSILRVLRPAESALRRLIVSVAAALQGRVGTRNTATGPLPEFAGYVRHNRRTAFRLIDPRKRFGQARQPTGFTLGTPRISVPGLADAARPTKADDIFDAAALYRRIAALDVALKSLPRQARRLNRLMARRAKTEPGPGRIGPIRPGHPPGFHKRSAEPVDDILRDCHWLALESGFKPP